MTTAWLYAGQGSQAPGMGSDFYEEYPQVRGYFDSPAAGFDLREICFAAPAETLSDTRYTQPCMAAFAAAVTHLLNEAGCTPDVTAGLSLGEYNALYAAGVFDYGTLLDVLATRGNLMADASEGCETRMVAVLGLQAGQMRVVIAEVQADAAQRGLGVVACTNFNCPGQVVIGGNAAAVEFAQEQCLLRGAKRCIPLATSGAFHTALMDSAAAGLARKLSAVTLAHQRVPVVFNVTGAAAPDSHIKELLAAQITAPVLFEQSLHELARRGVDSIIEIGPGHALSGFVRKAEPQMRVYSIETVDDFKKVSAL